MLHEITPLILTYNEEPNLSRALERLTWAKRVIVLDSFSTDRTVEIARSFPNVTVVQRAFDEHTVQWNFGVSQVQSEWVLALDADYVLGDGFEKELAQLNPANDVDVYFASFQYLIMGKALRGSLYPPRAVLFRKSRCQYAKDGHTQLLSISGKTESLHCKILHDDRKPLSRWFQSQDNYARLEAEKLFKADLATLRLQDRLRCALIPAAPLTFIYTLLIKGMILDGWRGWYYTLQRTIAEMMLALRLLEKHLQKVTHE